MKDEEMAVEYSKSVCSWIEDREPLDEKDIQEAFLAGLTEGRKEKWHDLRENPKDLPDACPNIVNQDGEKVRYDYVYEVWRTDDANDYICDDPIAWCEIPTFEE